MGRDKNYFIISSFSLVSFFISDSGSQIGVQGHPVALEGVPQGLTAKKGNHLFSSRS